jgi:hypothetical protein
LLDGPRPGGASFAGESGRIGGVPKRGGLLPKDSFSAEESADSPGPGNEDGGASPRPGSGVSAAEGSADVSWPGVGICRTAGEPLGNDGTGEPSRAIDCARGTEAAGELWPESRDDEGTALGFDDSGRSFAMAVYSGRQFSCCDAAVLPTRLEKIQPEASEELV